MISADSVRIGAHEQFHTLGRLLGVTTHNVFDIAELPELLYELRNCQFVMIDTAGTSPRDPELARQLRLLEPDAGQHRDFAGAAGQHPDRRHRRSGDTASRWPGRPPAASPRSTKP